jgi:hypothetical protein
MAAMSMMNEFLVLVVKNSSSVVCFLMSLNKQNEVVDLVRLNLRKR